MPGDDGIAHGERTSPNKPNRLLGTNLPGEMRDVIAGWNLGVSAPAASAVGTSFDALVKRLPPEDSRRLVRRISTPPVITGTTGPAEVKAAALPWLGDLVKLVLAGDIVAHEDRYRDAIVDAVRSTTAVIEHILRTR